MPRNTRRDSRKDAGRFRVLEIKRSGMETLPYTPERKWDSTATQMVEQFKDTGDPVFKSIRALNRGILKKKNGRDTTHFNADAWNTELLFRIIHSVNQFGIYGAGYNLVRSNSAWHRNKRDKINKKIRGQSCVDMCESTRSKSFSYLLQDQHVETVCGKTFKTSNHCPR